MNPDTLWKYGGYKNQWWSAPERIYLKDSVDARALANTFKNVRINKIKINGEPAFAISHSSSAYHAQGILGQYVYVNPEKKLVIVRLGQNWSHPHHYLQGFIYGLGKNLH